MAGHNDRIDVTIHPDNSVTVRRPRPRHPGRRRRRHRACPALTVVLTKLHAGGKFGGDGLQGLRRPPRRRRLGRERALRVARRRRSSATARSTARSSRAASRRATCRSSATRTRPGTTISFLPDSEIFEETEFSAQTLVQRLRETAFLTRGAAHHRHRRARRRRARSSSTTRAGSRTSSATSTTSKDAVHRHIVYFEGESDAGYAEVAMQWNTSYQESVFSFANNINTRRGRHPHRRASARR